MIASKGPSGQRVALDVGDAEGRARGGGARPCSIMRGEMSMPDRARGATAASRSPRPQPTSSTRLPGIEQTADQPLQVLGMVGMSLGAPGLRSAIRSSRSTRRRRRASSRRSNSLTAGESATGWVSVMELPERAPERGPDTRRWFDPDPRRRARARRIRSAPGRARRPASVGAARWGARRPTRCAPEADRGGDLGRQLSHRDLEAGAEIDRVRIVVALGGVHQAARAVLHVEELAGGRAVSPEDHSSLPWAWASRNLRIMAGITCEFSRSKLSLGP